MTYEAQEIQQLQNRAWELQRVGRYSEAIELFSECYERSAKPNYIYQRGRAYLEAEDYTAALEDMKSVVALTDPESMADSFFIDQGICQWCLGRHSQVFSVWEEGLDAPYTDASGGVVLPALILYGAERLNISHYRKLALRLLRRHMRRKLNNWPGAIVPYLLGQIDEESLDAAATTTSSETLQARRQCQADFYVALRGLRQGDWEKFKDHMNQCAKNPYGYHEDEYYLARWERSQGFPKLINS